MTPVVYVVIAIVAAIVVAWVYASISAKKSVTYEAKRIEALRKQEEFEKNAKESKKRADNARGRILSRTAVEAING